MKTKNTLSKIVQIAIVALFCTNAAALQAAEPEIVITNVPLIGQNGNADGKVVWDKLTPENAGQYAVIALLHATWPGGGGYYVKPYNTNYLNPIDAAGNFSIRITTGGVDADADEVIFYFVERATFNGINGEILNHPTTMTGKYLSTTTIYRSRWVQPILPSISPGLVPAGTVITLSCQTGGVIRYTVDGSNPITSASAQTYNNNVFTVPDGGALLIKAVVEISGLYGSVYSFTWIPQEPMNTKPLWGLNLSLVLHDEYFGYPLTESATRERMLPVIPLVRWLRIFGTKNNGQEFINQIAKEAGLRTMIGLYITNDVSNNHAQIEGLRQILDKGPADLIAIGNETSLLGVNPATLALCIDTVREMILERGLIIPVGSVDVAGASWGSAVLEKLDFIGVNTYPGTWDNTPENQMLDAMKQSFYKSVSEFSFKKLVLLTETGTPHSGGTYSFSGGTQTASKEKAANYLRGFLDWVKAGDIPAFYFEAYDEPAKVQESGHQIEQYFGIMDGNLKIHSWYQDCIVPGTGIPPTNSTGKPISLYPNPTSGKVFFTTESNIKFCDMRGLVLQEVFSSQIDLSAYPQGFYFLQVNGAWNKVVKK